MKTKIFQPLNSSKTFQGSSNLWRGFLVFFAKVRSVVLWSLQIHGIGRRFRSSRYKIYINVHFVSLHGSTVIKSIYFYSLIHLLI